jgi:hypothetical protein
MIVTRMAAFGPLNDIRVGNRRLPMRVVSGPFAEAPLRRGCAASDIGGTVIEPDAADQEYCFKRKSRKGWSLPIWDRRSRSLSRATRRKLTSIVFLFSQTIAYSA